MQMTPIKSSSIAAAGYSPGTRVLAVQFKTGRIYHYRECLPWHFEGLLAAPSAGKFLNSKIRRVPPKKRQVLQ